MKNDLDLHKQYWKKMSILIYHLAPPLIPHAAGIDDLSIEAKDISDQFLAYGCNSEGLILADHRVKTYNQWNDCPCSRIWHTNACLCYAMVLTQK